MTPSFGEQVLQFARAVDFIDDATFARVRKLIEDYTRNTLKVAVTRFMLESGQHENPSLIPYGLATKEVFLARPIRKANGEYGGQTCFAFDIQKPLWIVSAEGQPEELIDAEHFEDRWYGRQGIPKYLKTEDRPIRTSIVLPLRNDRERLFGVLNFETEERLDITESAKGELQHLADAISIVYRAKCMTKARKNRSLEALRSLEASLRHNPPKLTKPNVFIASASKARTDVIRAIDEVFKESVYREKFKVIRWDKIHNPGNINQQLLEELGTCRYGVCYFSERDESSENGEFKDNPNVLFEAGMLHGRTDLDAHKPASWIPIREKAGSAPPFDFASERMILVPRTPKGGLRKRSFQDLFRNRLDRLANLKE
ncbi:MAG: nucleotide-binding protein [Gammaproteobacteria bacterium]|nr:nucleotide-binding protein [Gammaproteobacteria bacterium]